MPVFCSCWVLWFYKVRRFARVTLAARRELYSLLEYSQRNGILVKMMDSILCEAIHQKIVYAFAAAFFSHAINMKVAQYRPYV